MPLSLKIFSRIAKYLLQVVVWLCVLPATAHVGSPDIFYEGGAGPYRLNVVVRVPQVIPGIAEVEVRDQSGTVTEVRIMALRLTGLGAEFAPAAEETQRSKQDAQSFTGSLWLMESGAMQIRVEALGPRGTGMLAVPVPAAALKKLPMGKPLGAALFALLVVLVLGSLFIVAAGIRQAQLAPGETLSPMSQRRVRIVMVVASVLLLTLLYLGKQWWNVEDRAASARIYSAPHLTAVLNGSDRLDLTLAPRQANGALLNSDYVDDLIPDHGHLMHLFLIRTPGMDAFVHLHPEETSTRHFAMNLPSMPAGHYQIFADVVHRSGLPATNLGEIDLPEISSKAASGDDCVWAGAQVLEDSKGRNESRLADGGRMVWERPTSLRAGVPASFQFRVEGQDGEPAQDMEPYMGMPGHAEFVRVDLSTFAHVHPAGSVSMAAVELAQAGLLGSLEQSQIGVTAPMIMPEASSSPEVSFPYGFPRPGDYRIFVQVKRSNLVETGVFDAHVD